MKILLEYYELVLKKIENKEFKIVKINSLPGDMISPHMEALNYMIFEFNEDYGDDRNHIFDYIINPDTDFDFTKISFEEFFKFIRTIKTDENITIDTKNIKIEEYNKDTKKVEIDDFWLK